MAARKRTARQIERDRAKEARWYVQGKPTSWMAQELGISYEQVRLDLHSIRDGWRASALIDFNDAKARELARIDELEATYREGWERSLEAREVSTRGKDETAMPAGQENGQPASVTTETKTKASIRTEKRDGNPAWLVGIQWCIEQRCKIFGLYVPNAMMGQPDDPDARPVLTLEQARAMAARVKVVDAVLGRKSPPLIEGESRVLG